MYWTLVIIMKMCSVGKYRYLSRLWQQGLNFAILHLLAAVLLLPEAPNACVKYVAHRASCCFSIYCQTKQDCAVSRPLSPAQTQQVNRMHTDRGQIFWFFKTDSKLAKKSLTCWIEKTQQIDKHYELTF